MMAKYKVTVDDAFEVATVLLHAPFIIGVELIGSVAREGSGNDLDLVVVVDAVRYATFVLKVNESWSDYYNYGYDYYQDFTTQRSEAAMDILALPDPLKGWLTLASKSFKLDMHLMPQGWKKRAAEVQQHLPHTDVDFVSNIAKDAKRFVLRTTHGAKRAVFA